MQAILHYLNCYQALKSSIHDINAASFKKDDLVNYRISKTIAHTFLSNPKVQLKKYAYLGSNAFEVIGYCNQDIINTLLGIMNKTLNNKDEDSKRYLKRFMYHLIFLNPEVEEEMLKNNFQLNEKIIWQAKMCGSLKGIDEKIIKIERSDISSEIFMKSLKFILNHYYDITNCKNEYELMTILFRSSILFFDSDELNQYLNVINQICFENISDPSSLKLQVIINDLSSHVIEDKSDIEEFSLNFKK